jgi:hypothetical protein
MTRTPRRALLALFAFPAIFFFTATATAAPPLFCEAYAFKAVQQQKANLAKGCGYAGQRWMKKYALHYAWCLGATPGAANGETWARADLLKQCVGGGAVKKFVAPVYMGLRLDWCRKWAQGCGQPAAKAFCLKKGYPFVKNFSMAENIGEFTNTRIISSGQVCSGPDCDGFTSITCSKTP